ncbi:ArsR family transcriptional regulator [Halobacteriales archaeon QH_10_67_13]|nr:MAG: ArsR family transcriptional regulator [Halobacteriales archaeon QH_10_67_13]
MTDNQWDPDNVIEVLASEESRTILSAASVRPMSAKELEQICDVSLPTVYRRINVLVEYGLLSEQQAVDPEKGQYKRFRTDLKEVRIAADDGGFNIDIKLRRDTVDRFGEMIRDLGENATGDSRGSTAEDDELTDDAHDRS